MQRAQRALLFRYPRCSFDLKECLRRALDFTPGATSSFLRTPGRERAGTEQRPSRKLLDQLNSEG
jgi:hypothetical protein